MRSLLTFSVVSLLLLFLSGGASAQERQHRSHTGSTVRVDTRPSRSRTGSRVPGELLGAVGGMLGSVGVAMISADVFPDEPVQTSALIGFGSLALTVPLGVFLTGNYAGGNGSFLMALLGGLVGGGLGLGLIVVADSGEPGSPGMLPAAIIGSLSAITGPILAYELSTDPLPRRVRTTTFTRASLRVSPTRGGATVGLAGSF